MQELSLPHIRVKRAELSTIERHVLSVALLSLNISVNKHRKRKPFGGYNRIFMQTYQRFQVVMRKSLYEVAQML